MSCLDERSRENISARSLVMTCVAEQGQLVSTLGASGSITGARDPEHTVSGRTAVGGRCRLSRQLSQAAGQPDKPAPDLVSAVCACPHLQEPTVCWASSQLNSRPGQGRTEEQRLLVFGHNLCVPELCDHGQVTKPL